MASVGEESQHALEKPIKKEGQLCGPVGEEEKKENGAGLAWAYRRREKRANSRWFLASPSSGFGGLQNGMETGPTWA